MDIETALKEATAIEGATGSRWWTGRAGCLSGLSAAGSPRPGTPSAGNTEVVFPRCARSSRWA